MGNSSNLPSPSPQLTHTHQQNTGIILITHTQGKNLMPCQTLLQLFIPLITKNATHSQTGVEA